MSASNTDYTTILNLVKFEHFNVCGSYKNNIKNIAICSKAIVVASSLKCGQIPAGYDENGGML